MDDVQFIHADARRLPLADESVQCIVTSPPYWGLRKYSGDQELIWGGSDDCDHQWREAAISKSHRDFQKGNENKRWNHDPSSNGETAKHVAIVLGNTCSRCGAWKGAYGLEPTIEMYVYHTVTILRECRRMLRKDGVLFWNIGDSYNSHTGQGVTARNYRPGSGRADGVVDKRGQRNRNGTGDVSLKPKDLCLIPERVALAAQADGWWVRSRILWCKPNPMPESVTDRPTDAAEHIWMFTKSEQYFWDADAVREPSTGNTHSRGYGDGGPKARVRSSEDNFRDWTDATREVLTSRNMRNVWTFATQPYPEAHFATFPEELPRRCILAATSAKGACSQCGAPWERVTRNKPMVIARMERGKEARNRTVTSGTMLEPAESATIGWMPTCRCRGQRGKTVPCVVLDPFGGSGTTSRVAIELGRRSILADVAYKDGDDYRRLAEKRTSEIDVNLPFL